MIPSYSSIDSHEGGGESQGILPLNAPGENHFHHDIRDKRPSFISTPIVVIFFAVASVSMLLIHNIDHKLFKSIDYETKDNFSNLADIRNLTVSSVSNVYGVWQSAEILPYPFLVNAILLEPYKETKIVIADPIIGCNYEWSFIKVDDDVVSSTGTSTNGSIDATLYTVGEYLLMASENCANTSDLQRQLRQTVWVKYVRRELSTLLHDDRENFLDAFHILWTTNTSAGQALYGDRYKSINYFATIHNDGGGNNVCDEFHGGYGFLNNHMYLSAYLEQSLQLVNPAVALHYMEYGKYFESDKFQDHLINQMDGGAWTSMLTAKFFGTSDPISGKIVNSRWANLQIPYMTEAFYKDEGIDPTHTFFPKEEDEWLLAKSPHVISPYGLLRSPWNFNPSPYLARYNNVFRIEDSSSIGKERGAVFKFHLGINCSTYQTYFDNIRDQPLQTSLMNMEDDTHGIFHFTFGGVGGDNAVATTTDLMEHHGFTLSNLAALSGSAQHFFKKHFAEGFDYPINCTRNHPYDDNNGMLTATLPGTNGGPQCDFSDAFYRSSSNLTALVGYFFNFDPDTEDSVVSRITSMEFSEQVAVMKAIANMFPFDGDLASSGAAMDPLFWVAHGAMERTFQKTVLTDMMSDMTYTKTGACSGHSAMSTKAWLDGYYFRNESINAAALTNSQLTAILDPTSDLHRDLVNFVYDTASYSWCENSDSWFD